ncbi:MAG TPA: hypothetical protein VFS65_01700 [Candidatus Saccharimonadales bacterium]|nr:hypothetical protein [Candidatus Saccharimonadales bacterium]
MSEREVFDTLDDGEPPSSGETRQHNLGINEYDDAANREHYEQHLEIWDLCATADSAIDVRLPERDFAKEDELAAYGVALPDDVRVQEGGAVLRRKRHIYENDNGEAIEVATYFLVNTSIGYQHSWTNQDTRVHQRHYEDYPALTECVKERLIEFFPDPRVFSVQTKQRLGLIARLRSK